MTDNERNLIINVEKTLTGEKIRTVTLTSAEAAWSLKYALINILGFKPEQVECFLDKRFLETYNLIRFARMVDYPVVGKKAKTKYLLSLMFPELYKLKVPDDPLDRYLFTLKHIKAKEIWENDKDLAEANLAVQWVLQVLFNDSSCKAVMKFAEEHPAELISLMRTMRLSTFYDSVYGLMDDGILDMVFFSYPKAIQKANFLDYIKYRLPETGDAEIEILKAME